MAMTGRPVIPQVERPISDPPDPNRRSSRRRGDVSPAETMSGVTLLAGSANVIMQLALPGVGYGVLESPVTSGRADIHPVKRARTTFTYLAVAAMGDDAQKAAFRAAVDRVHRQVRSSPESPVRYSAFDRELQLWVAACLYKGAVDVTRIFDGEMDDNTAERYYRESATLGTTLQVCPQMWPADRAAFDTYWTERLDQIRIDEPVREHLYRIAAVRMRGVTLPGPLHKLVERPMLFITTGFLPQRFRDEMRLPWDERKQRRFDALMTVLRAVNDFLPAVIRQFPFNVLLRDVNRRVKTGRTLV